MPQIWRSDLTDRAYPWPVSAYAMERAAERIARLATRGLDAVSFFREAQEALLAAVPATPPTFWHTLDPASLLITSSLDEEGGPTPHEVLEWEYFVDDVMKTVDAARDPRGLRSWKRSPAVTPPARRCTRRFWDRPGSSMPSRSPCEARTATSGAASR
jgi:hypothetical protein